MRDFDDNMYNSLTPSEKQFYVVGFCLAQWIMNTRVYLGVGYLK